MRAPVISMASALALSLLLMSPASAGATPSRSTADASVSGVSKPTTKVTVRGAAGQVLTVSKARNLRATGERVIVTGNRFDETVGIYVGLCVVPKKGQVPSPCGGGVDQSGASGASKWISSNPPPYGDALAIPFRPGGRFSVAITVGPRIASLDCRKVRCAVVVRADHLRSDDRSHDLFVPVTFTKK